MRFITNPVTNLYSISYQTLSCTQSPMLRYLLSNKCFILLNNLPKTQILLIEITVSLNYCFSVCKLHYHHKPQVSGSSKLRRGSLLWCDVINGLSFHYRFDSLKLIAKKNCLFLYNIYSCCV